MASFLDKTGLTYLWGKITAALVDKVSSKDTDADASLDITDSEGYVVARFADGDIKTKNFDSSQVYSKAEVDAMIAALSDRITALGG